MPYRLKLGRLEITCDTLEEFERIFQSHQLRLVIPVDPQSAVELSSDTKTGGEARRKEAIQRDWDETRNFAERAGLSKQKARTIIKKLRIEAQHQAERNGIRFEDAFTKLKDKWIAENKKA